MLFPLPILLPKARQAKLLPEEEEATDPSEEVVLHVASKFNVVAAAVGCKLNSLRTKCNRNRNKGSLGRLNAVTIVAAVSEEALIEVVPLSLRANSSNNKR